MGAVSEVSGLNKRKKGLLDMLTPQNFREKTFERAIFGGYDMASVDNFLDEAAEDYASLAKENMVLKSKMKVLVDKIEEYRSTEDSMRLSLMSVQKICAQMEQEAREKADAILSDAHNEAAKITSSAHSQRTTEEAKLLEAKRSSTKYIDDMRLACEKQLQFLEGLESFKLAGMTRPQPVQESVEETVRNIENSVEHMTDAPDASEEIGRVVADSADAPAPTAEEPTRLYNSAPAQGGQFSMDGVHFGK